MYVAELAAAAGLLLIAALLAHGGADLLAVGHARRAQLGVDAEAALEFGAQDIDLDIARAGDDGLVRLGVVDDAERRILLVELVEARAELLDLLLRLGGDGSAVARRGERHGRKLHIGLRLAERVAGLDLIHLTDGADVAAADFLRLLALLALHDIQAADLLGVAGRHVVERHIALDLAADDLDDGILAILVGDGLEHQRRGRPVRIIGHLDGVAVVILGGNGRHVGRNGHKVDDRLHQHLHAETGHRAAAEDRADAAVAHADLQTLGHLLVGELHCVEELLHQLLVGTGGGFHQLRAQCLDIVRHVGGDGALALGVIGLVMQQVDDGGHGLVTADDRRHQRYDALAELGLDRLEAGGVVAVFLLGTVDENHAGLLAQHFPAALHTDGQAILGAADKHGTLRRADGAHGLTGKVEISRSIHHIDLHALILHRSKGERNRDLALDFLRIVVAGRIAVGSPSQTIDPLGHIEHLLGQRGLAGAAVAQQRNIANVIGCHMIESPFVL